MTDNIKNLSDAEKKLSIEERARRAAYRIVKKYSENSTKAPGQAASGKTNKKDGMNHGDEMDTRCYCFQAAVSANDEKINA